MASLAHTTRRPSHVRTHLSAYLAGVGATSALTAGAVVAFLSLATFVAFNGLPFGGLGNDAGAAYLNSSASGSPASAATALGAARGAVARDPVPAAYRKGGLLRAGSGGSAGVTASGGDGSSAASRPAAARRIRQRPRRPRPRRAGRSGWPRPDPARRRRGPSIPSPPARDATRRRCPTRRRSRTCPIRPAASIRLRSTSRRCPTGRRCPTRLRSPTGPSLPNAPSLPNRPSLPNLPNLP